MDIVNQIRQYAPSTWECYRSGEVRIGTYTAEFMGLHDSLKSHNVHYIARNQDIYRFGQFLIRAQAMAVGDTSMTYFTVRRFMVVSSCDASTALKYNLDHRRCTSFNEIRLTKTVPGNLSRNHTLFVVKVITCKPHEAIILPESSLDFYIEYVVYFL